MDPHEFVKQRIEILKEHSETIRNQAEQTNDFDSWSALKLILHSSVTHMYTTVLSGIDYFDDYYYIDALAGSGVSTYDDNYCFIGSPIVAALSAREPFTKMYFIDQNEENCEALRARLDYVFSNPAIDAKEPDDWEVIQGDTNEKVPEVISEIKGFDHKAGYNYYCFIDNEKLDVKWRTIEALTPQPWGDLLINLPTAQAIGRTAATGNLQKLNEFYGQDLDRVDLPDENIREFMKQQYISRLAQRDRGVCRSTHVDANIGSFGYDMVYATRDIEGGNGYVKVVDYLKEMIENVHAGDVDNLLDILYGDQSTILGFLPDDNIENELPENEGSEDESLTQQSLDRWT